MQNILAKDIEKISLFFDEHSLREVDAGQLQSTIQFLQSAIEQCQALGKGEVLIQKLEQARKAFKRAKEHMNGRNERSRGFYESIRTAQKLISEALEQWNT